MEITVAKNAGFCFGVKRATDSLEERIRDSKDGERIFTLGTIIHNGTYNAMLEKKGVRRVSVTLHVGPGTFRPVTAENIEDHKMHEEYYEISAESAKIINDARAAGGRVIGPFSSNSVGGFQTGNTVGGEGWYAKTLNVTEEDLEGRVSLYFEGAYYYSWVYVNGKVCNHNVYGYSSFKFDITDQLHVGENSVVVRVVNNGNNTRWYAGSGIFRDVWMIRTPKLHADEWDTFVKTEDNSRVTVSALIHNDAD